MCNVVLWRLIRDSGKQEQMQTFEGRLEKLLFLQSNSVTAQATHFKKLFGSLISS